MVQKEKLVMFHSRNSYCIGGSPIMILCKETAFILDITQGAVMYDSAEYGGIAISL